MTTVVWGGFAAASVIAKICFVLIFFGNVLNWVAFTTTSWGILEDATDDYYIGLWRRCRGDTKGCISLVGYAKVWFGIFQGFACAGFAGVNATFFLVCGYILIHRCRKDREVSISAGFVGLLSAVAWIVSISVFGAEFEDDDDVSYTVSPYGDDLGYSFISACFCVVLAIVVGGLMLVECFYKQGRAEPAKKHAKTYREY